MDKYDFNVFINAYCCFALLCFALLCFALLCKFLADIAASCNFLADSVNFEYYFDLS